MIFRVFLICLSFLVGGCFSDTKEKSQFAIGRDPTWFPLNFKLQTGNINAFTNALIGSIARLQHVPMFIFDTDWNSLYQGLESGEYAGVFSSLPTNAENKDLYTFSDPFLLLGPVLVVPEDSSASSLDQLRGKFVGICQFDDTVLLVQKHPSIEIKLYQNMPLALEELAAGRLDAVLIGTLEGHALVPNLYPGVLKIVSRPLNDKALRLVALKGKQENLIKNFNLGLEKLQQSDQYLELREKFNVN